MYRDVTTSGSRFLPKAALWRTFSFILMGLFLLPGALRAQTTGCNLTVAVGTPIPDNTEVGCSSPSGQAVSALNPGSAVGGDAEVTVSGVSIHIPSIGSGTAMSGIGVTTASGAGVVGNATVTVSDTTIINTKYSGTSLGIEITVDAANGTSMANGILTMSGVNAITVGNFTAPGEPDMAPGQPGNGGGILVNVRGTGNASAEIRGRITVAVNTWDSEQYAPLRPAAPGSPGQNDGIEVTSRAGSAMLDMSNLDAGSSIFVNGGNGIFVDSLCQRTPPTSATCTNPARGGSSPARAGAVSISDISANLVITVDNSWYGSGWSGDSSGTANAGILASSYQIDGTVAIGSPSDPGSGNHATINTSGPLSDAIHGVVQGGNVDANPQGFGLYINNTGALTTSGAASNGIEAGATNQAFATMRYTSGAVELGAQYDSSNVEVVNSGAITTTSLTLDARANFAGRDSEHNSDPSNGIYASSYSAGSGSSGNIEVHNLAGGNITTQGRFSDAIMAETISAGGVAGRIVVSNAARLEASGDAASGIYVLSHGGQPSPEDSGITIANSGTLITHGGDAEDEDHVSLDSSAIHAELDNHRISITNSGTIISDQSEAVLAIANTSGAFSLFNCGTIFGGDAGIRLSGNFSEDPTDPVIDNIAGGTIGARSDLAIDTAATTPASPLWINNNAGATITGYVALGDAINVMNNAGQWNLRNYSEISGTLGVAVADFGRSGSNVINNSGTIALAGAPVFGASVNAAGEYLPLARGSVASTTVSTPLNASVAGGQVQGQILGVAIFSNSGVIDLTANAAAGDVLVISGGHTAGTDGRGVFVANGGSLRLNTVLNEGGIRSQSDMLVVDSTKPGSAPTKILVMNAGGMGAATVGDGIALVEVLNKGASASGVFALGGRAAGGAYDYDLYQNGVGADAADGNWYLRSGIRPEVAVDSVVPALAARLSLSMLGTSASRYGDPSDGSDMFSRNGNIAAGQVCADEDSASGKAPTYSKLLRPEGQCQGTLLWGRVFGERGLAGGSGAGPAYDFAYGGFQAGADLYRSSRNNAGLYAAVATASADVMAAQVGGFAGHLSLDAYGVGAYWTHRNPGGWYSDFVVQGDSYQDIRSRSTLGVTLATTGWGIAASAETGYVIALGDVMSVIPQGQLVYQRTAINDGVDPFGRIRYGATDEIYGRLGTRLARNWLTSSGHNLVTWIETSVWHQFGEDANTSFASLQGSNAVNFAARLGGTWAQLGLGLSGQLTRSVSLFGSGDYNIGLSDGGHGLGGRVGLRLAW
ncbi:MAG: autotransporter domain-containing protein [Alphaproteobacteria bacterium]|nr:autotransporter domain-containing protein [Alphaproteobacteria bacterium]